MCRIFQQLQYCPFPGHPPVGVHTIGIQGAELCACGISDVEYLDPIRDAMFTASCPICINGMVNLNGMDLAENAPCPEDLALSPVLQAHDNDMAIPLLSDEQMQGMLLAADMEGLALMQAQEMPLADVDLDQAGNLNTEWLAEVDFSQVSDEIIAAQMIPEQVEGFYPMAYQTVAGEVPPAAYYPDMPIADPMPGQEQLIGEVAGLDFPVEMGYPEDFQFDNMDLGDSV
ncbi:hypothetical protein QBC34DRAFT_379522 [Podospora aff. communis PSN243]|uniref:Uncharacterized protein n=1 Tax=Podospora aff. communis PSN243 TaxID=3040156 RepID=A0AAV9GUP4_9PEZI|nr:hypothetical protein QBC34DRAFT_379522 [Podospora aff. communis PSN243]